jgi:hypothetical protein
MWGLIAFGLLVLFVFVGYQAATKYRSPNVPAADARNTSAQSDDDMHALIVPLMRNLARAHDPFTTPHSTFGAQSVLYCIPGQLFNYCATHIAVGLTTRHSM